MQPMVNAMKSISPRWKMIERPQISDEEANRLNDGSVTHGFAFQGDTGNEGGIEESASPLTLAQ